LLPVVYAFATTVTNIVFKDAKVLKGPCPNCNTENFTYFGDILTVPGNRGTNAVGLCGVRFFILCVHVGVGVGGYGRMCGRECAFAV